MPSGIFNHILGKFSDAIKATEINCFLFHLSSYFTGLIPIKIRTRLDPASGGFVLAFQQENTRRLRLCSLFSVSGSAFSDTRFFLLWGSLLSSVGPHSISFGASFFRLSNTRSSCSSWASPLKRCWQRTQFSSVQNMRFRSFISIRPFINNLADGCASVGWRG